MLVRSTAGRLSCRGLLEVLCLSRLLTRQNRSCCGFEITLAMAARLSSRVELACFSSDSV